MNIIPNRDLLLAFINQYKLNSLFETDISDHMSLFLFQKGALVCECSSKLEYLYFLVSGKLKIYTLLANGKSLLLRFNKPLSVIGDVEFLNKSKVICNVEAQVDSYLIGIKFTDLNLFAYNDPTFLRFIITSLSHKLYTASNTASLNLLYPLETRFACYLLAISVKQENESRVAEIKAEKLTEVAMLLGTSYRHLNRIINIFRQENILSKEKKALKVLDFNKLKSLAKDNIYE